MPSSPTGYEVIIGRRPWRVWKGLGSFLLFEFGRPRKNDHGGKVGAYTLWIQMATWRIRENGRELAHSESSDEKIQAAADRFTKRKLGCIVLSKAVLKKKVIHGARFHFERKLVLQTWMSGTAKDDNAIFQIWTAKTVTTYGVLGETEVNALE